MQPVLLKDGNTVRWTENWAVIFVRLNYLGPLLPAAILISTISQPKLGTGISCNDVLMLLGTSRSKIKPP